jgi:hypothetical protein
VAPLFISRFQAVYTYVPYMCNVSCNSNDFYPVDVTLNKNGLQVVGDFPLSPQSFPPASPNSLQEAFRLLDPALRQICSNVTFPSDEGRGIIDLIQTTRLPLYGSSDSSMKEGRASHAWYVSTGKVEHLEDPSMHIKGCGPVDGLPALLSSFRGELNGITAASVISKLLLDFHSLRQPVHIHCDNQGVIKNCTNGTFHKSPQPQSC